MTEIVTEMAEPLAGFMPHPGSRMERTGSAAAQEAPDHHEAVPAPEQPFVVTTHSHMPEETIPRTVVLGSANPFLPVLPRDLRRRRAVLIATVSPVILCETKELAQQAAAAIAAGVTPASVNMGAYLPVGVALQVESRGLVYAVATSFTAATAGGGSLVNHGSVTNPGSNATIVSQALTQGTWTVTGTGYFTGTVQAGDASNMQIYTSSQFATLPVPPAANTPQQQTIQVVIPAGGGSVTIGAINAASNAAAVYWGTLVCTQTSQVASANSPVTVMVERYAEN